MPAAGAVSVSPGFVAGVVQHRHDPLRADEPVSGTRMVGIIREGRSTEVRAKLLHALADAWSEITGEAKESLVIFLEEIPGANALEDGAIGPDITEDNGAIYWNPPLTHPTDEPGRRSPPSSKRKRQPKAAQRRD
jgi:phenylpyruvate tautomerase PptA (4-oxalocrotonate tautomerase family)